LKKISAYQRFNELILLKFNFSEKIAGTKYINFKLFNIVMDNILILGSLPKTKEETKLYNALIEVAKEFATTVKSPIDTAKFKGTEKKRYERAFQMVKEASLVIGEQSHPSTGQGMEIRECAILNKPLIVTAKVGSKVSGLVKGCPITKEIIYYQNIKELKSKLKKSISQALCKKSLCTR
jgi:hypothetical protein